MLTPDGYVVVVGVEVGLGELVRVGDVVDVAEPDGDAVLVEVAVDVEVEVPVDVAVDVVVAVAVDVDVAVAVEVPVEVAVPVDVDVPVDVPVAVPVPVAVVGHVLIGEAETHGVCCATGFSFAPARNSCHPAKTHITMTTTSEICDNFLACMTLPSTDAGDATYSLKETNTAADRCSN